jgi:hypothetical protein
MLYVASNSYMGWGIWTPIFHNTWCIWTGITNICREFDLTKIINVKIQIPGGMPGGGDVKVSIWFAHYIAQNTH